MRISDWSSDVCSSDLLWWMIASPLISVWSFLLDGIFIGATRTAAMRNAMMLSLGVFLLANWLLVPLWGNHGLWLSMMLFLAALAVPLGLHYPALERSLGAGLRSVEAAPARAARERQPAHSRARTDPPTRPAQLYPLPNTPPP